MIYQEHHVCEHVEFSISQLLLFQLAVGRQFCSCLVPSGRMQEYKKKTKQKGTLQLFLCIESSKDPMKVPFPST